MDYPLSFTLTPLLFPNEVSRYQPVVELVLRDRGGFRDTDGEGVASGNEVI